MVLNQLVTTPYGKGIVKEIRGIEKNQIVIVPTNWRLANEQKPIFYLNRKDIKPLFEINAIVMTTFGKGKIINIRDEDGVYIIELSQWILATNKSPRLYLNSDSIQSIDNNIKGENDSSAETSPMASLFEQSMKKIGEFKDNGNDFFKNKNIDEAIRCFISALNILRNLASEEFVQSLSNIDKARILEKSIPCQNNLALCYIKTKQWSDCVIFSQNAVALINSIEKQMKLGISEVWRELEESLGITKNEFFVKWKRKSLYYLGRSLMMTKEYSESIPRLKEALSLFSSNNNEDQKLILEYQETLDIAIKLSEIQKKKEKATWAKAFKKNNDTEDISVVSNNTDKPPNNYDHESDEDKDEEDDEEHEDTDVSVSKRTSFPWSYYSIAAVSLTASAALLLLYYNRSRK